MGAITTVTGLAQSISFTDTTSGVLAIGAGLIALALVVFGVRKVIALVR